MPASIPGQDNLAYLLRTIKDLQNQVQALTVQQQFITGGGAFALPTTDPHVSQRLWSNSGVVTVSAG